MPSTITVQVGTYGRHGDDGYKVGVGEAWVLQRHGWTATKTGTTYHYVMPPVGGEGGPRVRLTVEVPTDKELIALATSLHERGVVHSGDAFGWPLRYLPAHSKTTTIVSQKLGAKGEWDYAATDIHIRPEQPTLTLGVRDIWTAEVTWDGDTAKITRSKETLATDTLPLFG